MKAGITKLILFRRQQLGLFWYRLDDLCRLELLFIIVHFIDAHKGSVDC